MTPSKRERRKARNRKRKVGQNPKPKLWVLDAGFLINFGNDSDYIVDHADQALKDHVEMWVPELVVVEAWKNPNKQVLLGKFLDMCVRIPLDEHLSKLIGILNTKAKKEATTDAAVVLSAQSAAAKYVDAEVTIWTSDVHDIMELCAVAEDMNRKPLNPKNEPRALASIAVRSVSPRKRRQ